MFPLIEDAISAFLKQSSENVFFCEMQEKRKIPVFPNGSAPSSGETPKEAAHHAGPELQRTGRWVQIVIHCGYLFGTRV